MVFSTVIQVEKSRLHIVETLKKYFIGKVNGLSPGSKVFKMHIRYKTLRILFLLKSLSPNLTET